MPVAIAEVDAIDAFDLDLREITETDQLQARAENTVFICLPETLNCQ
jgi:hypothetical protein